MYKIGEKEYHIQYYTKNREKILKYAKQQNQNKTFKINRKKYNQWYYIQNKEKRQKEHLGNREAVLKQMKEYYINSKGRMTKYRQTNAYKIYLKRHNGKRRKLGFFALNKYFEGADTHHISQNFVIFIPKELHKSIRHNLRTWKNMEKINKLAIKYL